MHIQFTSLWLVMSRTCAVNIRMDMSATITAALSFPASCLPRLCLFCCYLCRFLLFFLTVFADFVFNFSSYPESRELNFIHCDHIVPRHLRSFLWWDSSVAHITQLPRGDRYLQLCGDRKSEEEVRRGTLLRYGGSHCHDDWSLFELCFSSCYKIQYVLKGHSYLMGLFSGSIKTTNFPCFSLKLGLTILFIITSSDNIFMISWLVNKMWKIYLHIVSHPIKNPKPLYLLSLVTKKSRSLEWHLRSSTLLEMHVFMSISELISWSADYLYT